MILKRMYFLWKQTGLLQFPMLKKWVMSSCTSQKTTGLSCLKYWKLLRYLKKQTVRFTCAPQNLPRNLLPRPTFDFPRFNLESEKRLNLNPRNQKRGGAFPYPNKNPAISCGVGVYDTHISRAFGRPTALINRVSNLDHLAGPTLDQCETSLVLSSPALPFPFHTVLPFQLLPYFYFYKVQEDTL